MTLQEARQAFEGTFTTVTIDEPMAVNRHGESFQVCKVHARDGEEAGAARWLLEAKKMAAAMGGSHLYWRRAPEYFAAGNGYFAPPQVYSRFIVGEREPGKAAA